MALPSSNGLFLAQALNQVLGQAAGTKQQAQDALTALQNPVPTATIFNMLDAMADALGRFNRFKGVQGLDAYASAQVPGYSGSMAADIAATQTAIQACIDWIVTNFPKDTSATWLLAFQLSPDGSRTPRSFSSAQTAGLQTKLQALIATIA